MEKDVSIESVSTVILTTLKAKFDLKVDCDEGELLELTGDFLTENKDLKKISRLIDFTSRMESATKLADEAGVTLTAYGDSIGAGYSAVKKHLEQATELKKVAVKYGELPLKVLNLRRVSRKVCDELGISNLFGLYLFAIGKSFKEYSSTIKKDILSIFADLGCDV